MCVGNLAHFCMQAQLLRNATQQCMDGSCISTEYIVATCWPNFLLLAGCRFILLLRSVANESLSLAFQITCAVPATQGLPFLVAIRARRMPRRLALKAEDSHDAVAWWGDISHLVISIRMFQVISSRRLVVDMFHEEVCSHCLERAGFSTSVFYRAPSQ